MKILIDSSFIALRVGAAIKADESVAEFLVDTDNLEDRNFAIYNEISLANGFGKLPKNKEIEESDFITNLLNLELPIMNEITETEKVAVIVAEGIAAGKTDDEILHLICASGISYANTGKLFKAEMVNGGYRITAKARKEKGREILVEAEFSPENYDELKEMVETLKDSISDTSTSQANAIVKAYAKEFEIELPKPEKKASSGGGLRAKSLEWMVGHPEATREELANWLTDIDKNDAEGKILNKMWTLFLFGKAIRAA